MPLHPEKYFWDYVDVTNVWWANNMDAPLSKHLLLKRYVLVLLPYGVTFQNCIIYTYYIYMWGILLFPQYGKPCLYIHISRFPTALENMGRLFKMWWGGLEPVHEGSMGGGCRGGGRWAWSGVGKYRKGVHFFVRLPAISQQAKIELLHTFFSRILARC